MKNSLPHGVVRSVFLLLEDLGTPFSLGVAIRLRYEDWDGISAMKLDPRVYCDPERYGRDAAAFSIVRKLQQLPTTVDRRSVAIEKWWQGEKDCFQTNVRLTPYLEGGLTASSEGIVCEVFSLAKKIILDWLGSGPPVLVNGRHGPGATYSDPARKATVLDKMSSDPSLTHDALWFLPQWLGTWWGTSVSHRHGELQFVRGNRFTTVPKDCRTDRAIASEPSVNVFYQLGLGAAIRRRLKSRAKWDLNCAQDIHRKVAMDASVSREFATLDLSNASDTVSRNLVKILLPPSWFSALDDLRSKRTLMPFVAVSSDAALNEVKRWVLLEKFSSMGNGFTFELETLIFAALCCATLTMDGVSSELGENVFVFGDDIIVPRDKVQSVISVLRFCGFSLNDEKSYYGDEPFRESCGGDYFDGKPVRGLFLKEVPHEPDELIAYANGLRALSERLELSGFSLPKRAWFAVLDLIPIEMRRCRGPKGLGDIVIHDEEDRWTVRWRTSFQGDRNRYRYIRVFRPHRFRRVRYEWFAPEVVLACATYGTGNSPGGEMSRVAGLIPRDGVLSYKVGWMPLP